jgi:hypothetical protein
MGALAPPPMGAPGPARDSQSFTNPDGDPLDAAPSEPSDNKMTEAIPAPVAVRKRRTPHNLSISADTEANDPDDEEGGPTASILPGQLAALAATRRPPPPPPVRSRNPLIVVGISFTVVLLLGIILLLVLRGRSAPAAPAPTPSSPSGDVAAPGVGPEALASMADPLPDGPMKVSVRFDAPSGTVIQQGDQRFTAGVSFRVLPGTFDYEYRCPGRSAPIATTANIADGRSDTQVIPIRCGLAR